MCLFSYMRASACVLTLPSTPLFLPFPATLCRTHTHTHLCECFQVYLIWFGLEGGSGVFCIIALRNLWSLNALAKTLLLGGGFTQTQTLTHMPTGVLYPVWTLICSYIVWNSAGWFVAWCVCVCVLWFFDGMYWKGSSCRSCTGSNPACWQSLILTTSSCTHTHTHTHANTHTLTTAGPGFTQKVQSLIGRLHFSEVGKFLWHRRVLHFECLLHNRV